MELSDLEIFFWGEVAEGTTSKGRMEGLQALGCKVDWGSNWAIVNGTGRVAFHLARDLGIGPIVRCENRALLAAVKKEYDVIWIEKGIFIELSTIKALRRKARILIHFTPDHAFVFKTQTRHFIESLSYFDICGTTKPGEVEKYYRYGAPHPILVQKSYNPKIHKLRDKESLVGYRSDIAFVGAWTRQKEDIIALVLEKFENYNIILSGSGWTIKTKNPSIKKHFSGPASGIFGENYGKIISGARVGLGLLANDPSQHEVITARTIEIPACGALLVSPRSKEIEAIFTDGKDALLYDSNQEMINKISWALDHEQERAEIARAGFERVTSLGLRDQDVVEKFLLESMRISGISPGEPRTVPDALTFKLKIFFWGPVANGTTSESRRNALRESGHHVETGTNWGILKKAGKIAYHSALRIGVGPLVEAENARLLETAKGEYDLIWIEKGIFLKPTTLRILRKQTKTLVHFTPDPAFNFHTYTNNFKDGISIYDVVGTTKPNEINRYKELGAKKVVLLGKSYNPLIHKEYPSHELEGYRSDVTFAGTWTPGKDGVLDYLINAFPDKQIRIWGGEWRRKCKNQAILDRHFGPSDGVFGENYGRALAGARISLGLLSTDVFPDEVITDRIIEIPACGSLLIAPATKEISEIFEDGVNALLYRDTSEMIEKIRWALDHEEERALISKAGQRKIIEGPFRDSDIVASFLGQVRQIG